MNRESLVPLLARLYRTDGSFRGFIDFAVCGGITLLFLSPISVPNLTASFSSNSQQQQSLQTPQRPATTAPVAAQQHPGPVAPTQAPTPSPPTPRRSTRHPLDDPDTQIRAFLHLSPKAAIARHDSIIQAIVARDFDAALRGLDQLDRHDPNVPFLRGVALLRKGADLTAVAPEYEKAVELGHPQAMYFLGTMAAQGRLVPLSKTRAFELWSRGYELGSDTAGYYLALRFYAEGDLGYRDDHKARPIFEKLAATDHPNSLNMMGLFYAQGRGGLRQDDVKAVDYYRRSAEAGNPIAMRNLSWRYRNGRGIQKDANQALAWLQRSADAGDVEALRLLGRFLAQGEEGTTPDPVRGATLLRQAALKNDGPAQELLGELYEQGRGLPRDPLQAYVFYGLASHHGVRSAAGKLATLRGRMSNDEKERAERLLAGALPSKAAITP